MDAELITEAYDSLVMEPDELTAAMKALGLSLDEFTVCFGIANPRTVRRWQTGEKEPPGPVIVMIDLLLNCPAAREYMRVGEFLPPEGYTEGVVLASDEEELEEKDEDA